MTNPTERFSNRVANYVRYRPHYPQAVVACLQTHCRLTETAVIADVGSGTGLLTELFLRHGNTVYGIEPNCAMREAGEQYLHGFPNFHSIAGTAEETTLAPASVDFVTAGQAFHWFDPDRARAEFRRILRPEGWVVLVWNERQDNTSPFAQDYETLLRTYGTDYAQVHHKRIDQPMLRQFFGGDFQSATFPNHQQFDWNGLQGRLLSSSYAPEAGTPQYAPMLAELRRIFEAHQVAGTLTFAYDTNIHFGHLT